MVMEADVQAPVLTDREKYLFDLQGYLVVENFLTGDEVRRLNEAIDANLDTRVEDESYLAEAKALEGEHRRGKLGGMLLWDRPWCEPFRDLIVHPKLVGYLNGFLGRGWHMDHMPTIFHSVKGTEGLGFHLGDPHWQGGAYYVYRNGEIRNGLMVFQYALTDQLEGQGGFGCIPGSHKTNFLRPLEIDRMERDTHVIRNPSVRAGDLLIFTEALTHGTLPWTADHERRAALYRYAPKWVQYGPGFHEATYPEWVQELTEAQQAALEPAYFYNRPLIEDDGETVIRPPVDADEPPYRYGADRRLFR